MMRRWLRGFLVIGVVLAAVVLLVYGLPRLTGDRFASALINLNIVEAKEYLCPDTSVGQIASLFGGDNTLGEWLAQQLQGGIQQVAWWPEIVPHLQRHSTYDVFSGAYTVWYEIGEKLDVMGFQIQAGVRTPLVTLGVRRLNLISFCLTTA
jgi:hypothetical protein